MLPIIHDIKDLHQWYLLSCRRIAIHPFALPITLLAGLLLLFATPAPCMEPEDKVKLREMEEADRKARIRQLYAYHERRDPCDVQERILLERIDSAQAHSP